MNMSNAYGLLGTLATESDTDTTVTMSLEQEVLADEAFYEAGDIAQEAEQSARDMAQAIAVAGQLDVQSALGAELLANPEQITTGAVAASRESMVMALTALGAPVNDFVVSRESMTSAPVAAMEVTHEGMVDTAKKIYEGIKMIFKKIALNIKKLAAKLVVAMNGTGKKAEKMLKSFKANKELSSIGAKVTESEATALIKNLGGAIVLAEAAGADTVGALLNKLADNVKAVTVDTVNLLDDLTILSDIVTKDTSDDKDEVKIAKALSTGAYKSMTYKAAAAALKSGKAVPADVTPGTFSHVPQDMDDLGLDSDVISTSILFTPTHFKGNRISGIVTYVTKLDDGADVTSVASSVKSKTVTITAFSDDEIEELAKSRKVMSRTEIETSLGDLKSASKDLKSFSNARMKDIDTLMKAIDKLAKAKTGLSILNRLSGSNFNKARMFAASTHLTSIFAAASAYKRLLANISKHISYYK